MPGSRLTGEPAIFIVSGNARCFLSLPNLLPPKQSQFNKKTYTRLVGLLLGMIFASYQGVRKRKISFCKELQYDLI